MQNISLLIKRKHLSFWLLFMPCYFCAEGVIPIFPYGQSSSLKEISKEESFVFLTGIMLHFRFVFSFGFIPRTFKVREKKN